jgi:hypothetical protein
LVGEVRHLEAHVPRFLGVAVVMSDETAAEVKLPAELTFGRAAHVSGWRFWQRLARMQHAQLMSQRSRTVGLVFLSRARYTHSIRYWWRQLHLPRLGRLPSVNFSRTDCFGSGTSRRRWRDAAARGGWVGDAAATYPGGDWLDRCRGGRLIVRRHKSLNEKVLKVPEEGVEPSLSCENWILNPARLPFRHSGKCLANHQFTGIRQAVNGSSAA